MDLTEKPIYKRVLACFCAFLICCLVVFCGFSISKVCADSVNSVAYDTYIDGLKSGMGASSFNDGIGSVIDGVQIGLDIVSKNPIFAGGSIRSSAISTLQGFFYYNSVKHLCVSTVTNGGQVFLGDRLVMAQSDLFSVSASIIPLNNVQAIYYLYLNSGVQPRIQFQCVPNSSVQVSVALEGGQDIFPSSLYTGNLQYGEYNLTCVYSNSYVILQDNLDTVSYFRGLQYIAGNPNTQYLTSTVSDWGGDVTIDLSDLEDWTVNVFNPYVEENYPDYIQYLFVPPVEPTETGGTGCNCHVDVYVEPTVIVNVEPTIIVDNNIDFPSEWYTDYTSPSIPSHETIPFPTQDSSNTELVTMPTMDVDEYKQTYGNAIEFWFFLAAQLIEKLGLELLTGFAFVLSVVGFVLWRLGSSGGGKND